ncbi:uncharacterized protein LOC143230179 [Tachypleus tridentatus]|uniref:uncharacterized protein LOC143230179 n=1 Tax=Tachypleus tridentatus TaxID=6853 RepID=UPI003FD0C569
MSSFAKFVGKQVRIGCASGFWGDTATAVPQLVHHGKLDFLVFDYLSEITMSLLAAAKQKSPDLGFTPDFVHSALKPNINEIKRRGIRVVSNAGGINPFSCASALQQVIKKAGVDLKVAVITGDDLMDKKEELLREGITEISEEIPLPKNLHSMNAYLGAGPVAQALEHGADIVITGRCVDSALALGPLMHSFKWKSNELNALASGSLAGHLIECGAQVTGGIFTDWEEVPGWENMGFPIVDCSEDGRFIVTKPPGTGGLVTTATVAEQLVYEIGDARRYQLPDVICDFSNVQLKQVGENEVLVEGAKGRPASPFYKVCATYSDGFRATAVCPVKGPRSIQKAQKTAEAILKRCSQIFKKLGLEGFRRTHIDILGSEQSYGAQARPVDQAPREAVLWIAVHHNEKQALEIFGMEIAASATGAAPGLTTLVGGRPKPVPVLKLFSFLHPKDRLEIKIHTDDHTETFQPSDKNEETFSDELQVESVEDSVHPEGQFTYRLEELAYTRSGDKGDTCNIGVIARHPAYYPYLCNALTPKKIKEYFNHLFDQDSTNKESTVQRYLLPGIHGMNFVLKRSLGGGGIASLRSDPQGKALGQILLDLKLENFPSLKDMKS